MPYAANHKEKTRKRILAAARRMFIKHGYSDVSIDVVMAEAGLTRGGFYNHFTNKEELFAEAISSYMECQMDADQSASFIDFTLPPQQLARRFIDAYLSDHHLGDQEGICPMIALPSDVARAGEKVQASYQRLFEGMVSIFEKTVQPTVAQSRREQALALAATCVGGMVLARAMGNSELSGAIRTAAQNAARQVLMRSQPVHQSEAAE